MEKKSRKGLKLVFSGIRNVFLVFLDVSVMLLAGIVFFATYAYWKSPSIEDLSSAGFSQTSLIYDRTGEHLLYKIHGEENRKVIPFNQIPENIKLATIAAEDNNFYSHPGLDFLAIVRAAKTDLENKKIQEGASTITQQLARNVYLTREKTFRRKILEIILAVKMEQRFSKDQILEMYLNQVPYGSNAYGIHSASQIFFKKDPSDLTLDEAALLANLPNAPTLYSPHGSNSSELLRRRDKTLEKMSEMLFIDEESARYAKEEDTLSKIAPFVQPIEAPHFVFHVLEQLEKTYGRDLIEKGGFKIYTTLDWEKQKLAENIIREKSQTLLRDYSAENAALVSIDIPTGEILAMVGSKNYFDKTIDGKVNVATRPRQPGSSFKPFAYAAAFEKGYQPETRLYDVPTNFGPDGSGKNYTPSNYDGGFRGLVSMRQALAMSLNIPAVKTLYLAGINDTINLAERLGITTLKDRNRYGLALVLGGGEVTLLEETAGYAVFGNDGKRNRPTPILKITDSSEKTIFESRPEEKKVLDQQVARKINSILSDNQARSGVFGTRNQLHIPGLTVAAKTGTTQNFRDAWTVGYTPRIATGVWVGNNDNRAMRFGADGSYVAAPIWNSFMSEILKNYPDEKFADYDRSGEQSLLSSAVFPKVTYFDTKKGKEISEEKARKTSPEKVETRIEFPRIGPDRNPLVAEMQPGNDPMLQRWRQSIGSTPSSPEN